MGAPTGGTWTLSFTGSTTGGLTPTATAAQAQAALNALVQPDIAINGDCEAGIMHAGAYYDTLMVVVTQDASEHHGGAYSAKQVLAEGYNYGYIQTGGAASLLPGHTYEVSVYCKVVAGFAQLYINTSAGNSSPVTSSTTGEWELMTFTFQIPADAAWAYIYLHYGWASTGPIYWDDLVVRDVTNTSLFTVTGGPAFDSNGVTMEATVYADYPLTADVSGLTGGRDPSITVETTQAYVAAVAEEFSVYLSNATGGTFTLTFAEGTTVAIAWNASSEEVRNAINPVLVASGKSVLVSGAGTESDRWIVTFEQVGAQTDPTGDGDGLTETLGAVVATISDGDGENQSEVQTLYLDGATGGTFTISMDSGTTYTNPISASATAAEVEAALEAQGWYCSAAGSGSSADPWVITFDNYTSYPEMMVDPSGLLPVASVEISVTTQGVGAVPLSLMLTFSWQTNPGPFSAALRDGSVPGITDDHAHVACAVLADGNYPRPTLSHGAP